MQITQNHHTKVNTDELKQGGQALYRFLLDEGMVNQNAVYRDVMGLVEETQKCPEGNLVLFYKNDSEIYEGWICRADLNLRL